MDAGLSTSAADTDPNDNPFAVPLLDSRVLVKCGGFSSQLSRNVAQKVDGDPLWGSRFDQQNPEAVIQTHLDFLRNGADIILTNTYQSSVEGFMKHLGMTREESVALIAKSVQLTQQAKTRFFKEMDNEKRHIEPGLPLILASIGPYGAHLHDGSEYTGSYQNVVDKKMLQNWHSTRIKTCLLAGVDGLAVETMPCLLEAEAVTELILKSYANVRFWVSFQCKDETSLANGEPFAQAAHTIWRLVKGFNEESRLLGIGVNCVNPTFVTSLFRSLNALAGNDLIPLVVYSNRGEIYDSASGEWVGTGQDVAQFVPEWVRLGARIVGGCCRVYPADVLQIRKCIDGMGVEYKKRT